MRLNDRYVKLFKVLGKSTVKGDFLDFLEDLKRELFDPTTLTPQNLEARKEAVKIINEELVKRLSLTNEEKVNNPNDYV